MYYRIAIRVDASPTWKWKSAALSSQYTLIQWLQYYRVLPHDRLRIFSSSSQEELNEQLVRENQGLLSTSVPATQFLQGRGMAPREVGDQACGAQENRVTTSSTAFSQTMLGGSGREAPVLGEGGLGFLEKRRAELEGGAGGDHDLPYQFALPTSMPLVLAWVKLLGKIQQGGVQP